MNKRGLAVIFIIIGVLIVVAVGLFFLVKYAKLPSTSKSNELNPDSYLEICIEKKVKQAVDIMLLQGGYINASFYKYFQFSESSMASNISYLCYTQYDYLPCVNQEPMLMNHVNNEIKNYVSSSVQSCFIDYINDLESQGYVTNYDYNGFDLILAPSKIIMDIDGKITFEKGESSSTQNEFQVITPTMFYDLLSVAQEIVSQEARFCNFDYIGFMQLNSEFEILKFKTSDFITLYRIKNKNSDEEFRFAIRGCVIPGGV